MQKLLLVLLVAVVAGIEAGFPESLTLNEGQGFLLRLDQNDSWTKCDLWHNGHILEMLPDQETLILDTAEIISRFEPNTTTECGFRVQNVGVESKGLWTVFGYAPGSVLEYRPLTIRIVTNPSGNGDDSLYPPLTKIFSTSSGSQVIHWQTGFFINECSCKHLPSGFEQKIEEGQQYVNYSAYKSDFKRGLCQFEIMNIQGLDNRTGIWEMTTYDNIKMKASIVNGPTMVQFENDLKVPSVTKTTYVAGRVSCIENCPFMLDNCYITEDGGDISFLKDEVQLRTGKCEFYKIPGNYSCGFSRGSYRYERVAILKKYDSELIDKKVQYNKENTTLEVHHIWENKIEKCMFFSPSDVVYEFPWGTVSEDYSFYGGSLAKGDCGIALKKTLAEQGDWKVSVKLIGRNEFLQAKLFVQPPTQIDCNGSLFMTNCV